MLQQVLEMMGPVRETPCEADVRCWVPTDPPTDLEGMGPVGPTFVALFPGHDSAALFVEDLGEELGFLPPLDDYYDGHLEGSASIAAESTLVNVQLWAEGMEARGWLRGASALGLARMVCIGQRIVHETLAVEPSWAQLAKWESIAGPLTSRSWGDERSWAIGAG